MGGTKKTKKEDFSAQAFYDHSFLGNDEEMMFSVARQDSFAKAAVAWPFTPEESSCTMEKVPTYL